MNYNNTLVMHFDNKAIFINDENELFFINDENGVLDLCTSIESDILTSIDELGEDSVKQILQRLFLK
ncbi:MAG: hypothetical protein RSA79_00130 [Oscillospiraceae bacterium]